jgi:ATP-binding protein involved in chromosome partitioning
MVAQRTRRQTRPATLIAVPAALHTVAVASGKGGVGKSTVALNLALALHADGARVGLLDADFYGPDIPLMVNVKRDAPLKRWDLWRGDAVRLEPVERYGLKLMSVGFLLGERQALPFNAQSLGMALQQFVNGTDWGELDFLVIDLPPGTADLQDHVARTLDLSGAVIVVGPQDAAHLDAKRVVEHFQSLGVRVLGGVENMSGLVCPHCDELVDVFPRVSDERSLWSLGVAKLATVPIDPALGRPRRSGDVPERFRELARSVRDAL